MVCAFSKLTATLRRFSSLSGVVLVEPLCSVPCFQRIINSRFTMDRASHDIENPANYSWDRVPPVDQLSTVARASLEQLIAVRQGAQEEEGVSLELLQHLLWQEDSRDTTPYSCAGADFSPPAEADDNSPDVSYPQQRCFAKPALNTLMCVLEGWWVSNRVLPPPRAFDDKAVGVPGVVEILPEDFPAFSRTILHCYESFREAVVAYHKTRAATQEANRLKKEADKCFHDLLNALGKIGILYLLGHRSTVGTLDRLCPPVATLVRSFQKPHKEGTTLSVGGRALTKHCHRGGDSFWPQSTGNNDKKNALALEVLYEILDHAAWVNMHAVPMGHGEQMPIVETRHVRGYGARWSADGTVFRGFLEPVSPFHELTETVTGKLETQ
jgi:hypothetical protein